MAKSTYKYYLFIWFIVCSYSVNSQRVLRSEIIREAKSHIGIVEATNRNDGYFIENFLLKPFRLPKGTAYCAAYTSYVYNTCGVKDHPNSAYSPMWAKKEDAVYFKNRFGDIKESDSGDIVSFWIKSKSRVGHVGIFVSIQGNYVYTIEGNTSDMNDKGRDGVFGKTRHKSSIHTVTTYIR